MKQKLLSRNAIILYLLAGITLIYLSTGGRDKENGEALFAQVNQGNFEITVVTTGEIRAKHQTDIDAPGPEMREAGLWNGTKIQDLVPEGSVVKAGDFVASLDKSALMSKLQEVSLEYDKKSSELKQARLDTAITLRDARDELLNLKSGMEEAQLELDQSAYEAPAIQRQKQLALEKANRSFEQKKINYKTKVEQSATKVAIIYADLQKAENSLNRVSTLMQKMEIRAPEDGMVIYVKSWSGKKKGVGSTVSPWESAVATLPDLREMQVLTYVNEVDIRKIKTGQAVKINLDAEPEKKLEGVVVQVANIGEQRPNQDSKVFEVVIDILTQDSTLRPSMTTSNSIQIEMYKDVLFVPLESVNTHKNHSFVWVKDGGELKKQEIKVAAVNDMSAVIYAGAEAKQTVYLTSPTDTTGEQLIVADSAQSAPKPFIDADLRKKLDAHLEKQKASVRLNKPGEEGMTIFISE
jgi:multidrug efflux pump subunit AcrA (membrane-fusion protein)